MIRIFALLLCGILLNSCHSPPKITSAKKDAALTSYVNPFIGTGGHGHTYPGATLPFGMVQLSPDTRLDGWDGCSGYHYSDDYIFGFSHTHLSGTGVSDYGDILMMPTTNLNFNNGANESDGYGSHFSHDNEIASPGFYSVHLDDTNIDVALTVHERSGYHKYEYPSAENQWLILDLTHRDMLLDARIIAQPSNRLRGFRHSKAWATDQRLWYDIEFSHAFEPANILGGKDNTQLKVGVKFINPNNEPVYAKVGISAVDAEGALKNREAELNGKSFEQVKNDATEIWEKQLEKIIVESDNLDHKTNFYTSMYHSMIAPNLYQDVDGRYRGMDLKIHETQDFKYYTVFSLWDTYRAAHPLYTIIEQERSTDFIKTMLAKYQEGGILPIWDLSANYTGCMIGYHGVPVIADAYLKGIEGIDAEMALEAMKNSATQNHLGLKSYQELGFIPVEEESESVSKTLEYAYDDWSIAQMAKKMGKTSDYIEYMQRAQSYKNIFNPKTNFFQGRFNNTWFGPFDPFEVNFNYTEANAWQYSLYAPQDISGLIKLMGGKEQFKAHLDHLFSANTETSGRNQADITGLIGQYAHGNEPSHHMAYLYNYVNEPQRTQELVHQILTTLYTNAPDGISGNEDCGQMSAWYILSAMGFYPVTPGSNEYIIGSPLFPKTTINLESGNTFTIVADKVSDSKKYIASATLNGEALNRTFLYHEEIINGGVLAFEMTDAPNKWGTADDSIPISEITEHPILTAPFIADGDIVFKNNSTITLEVTEKNASIYYSLNDSKYREYTSPLKVEATTLLKTYSQVGDEKSKVMETKLHKIDPNRTIELASKYANEYSAGGDDALIDGIKGAKDFRTGAWQGYQDQDLVAIVDLGSIQPIDEISVNFLQDQKSWIFLPTEIECFVSPSRGNFHKSLPTVKFDAKRQSDSTKIETATFNMKNYSARFIKIVAKNVGALPEWHLGFPYNGKAWIFVDEIEIK